MGHIELAAPVAHVWYTRRVPSYMGLLLDISRRNLERVLYFAQYVVTYVDEDARQKAMKRQDEDLDSAERQQGSRTNEKIAELKTMRDQRLADKKAHIAAVETRYNDEISSKLSPLINEGQNLESDLQRRAGKVIRKEIVFEAAGQIIAQVGEEIGKQHLSRVQK